MLTTRFRFGALPTAVRSSSSSSRILWYAASIERESWTEKAEYFFGGAGGFASSAVLRPLMYCGLRLGIYHSLVMSALDALWEPWDLAARTSTA